MGKKFELKIWLLLIGVATIYTGLLWCYAAPVTIGSDQASWFRTAKMLAVDGAFYYRNFMDLEFTGNFWVINSPAENRVYSVYPPGYALLLAGAQLLGGENAPHLFNAVAAGLAILLMYGLSRFFLAPRYALFATFILLTAPVLFLNAQLKNSHTAGLVCTLSALILLFHAVKKFHGFILYATLTLSGFLLGFNTALRYPEILLLLVPSAYLLTTAEIRDTPQKRRSRFYALLAVALGAAMPLGGLAIYHWYAFDSFFRTGYSLFYAAAGGFAPEFFSDNLWIYLPGMVNYLFGAAFFLLFIPLCCPPRSRRFRGWFWLAWLAPIFLLYHFYFWAAPDAYFLTLRFYLNLIPAMIIFSVIAWRNFTRYLTIPRGAVIVFGVVQVLWSGQFITASAEPNFALFQRAYRQVAILRANVQDGAIVFFLPKADMTETLLLDALAAEHRWHLYSADIFDLARVQSEVQKRLADTENLAVAGTFQPERSTNLLNADCATMFQEFYTRLQREVKRGTPLYFYGESTQLIKFKTLTEKYLTAGNPTEFPLLIPAYFMFPQGHRTHNDPPKLINKYPDLTLTPLFLRDKN